MPLRVLRYASVRNPDLTPSPSSDVSISPFHIVFISYLACGRLTNSLTLTNMMFASAMGKEVGYLQEPEDIPKNCNQPVWILGREYSGIDELDEIREDVRTCVWSTYRRNFTPVGSPQLTTDKGWGCMLRCGQMILAKSLIDLHLSRSWRWTPETRYAV